MSPHQGIRVSSLTTGVPSHRFEHLRINYVYGGSGGGDDDDDDDDQGTALPAGNLEKGKARAARLALFAAARAEGASVAEAGRAAGVTPTTAKAYRRELEQASGGEQQPEPREIVAALHGQIAAQSPGHAALVAEFEARQQQGGSDD